MNFRIACLYVFTLISLFPLIGLAAQAGAQDNSSNSVRGSPSFQVNPRNADNAEANTVGESSTATFKVLYNFCSVANCADGDFPDGLILDAAGNVYGTTQGGGANSSANAGIGGGTVFKVDSTGTETVLYNFCSSANCADGEQPQGRLIKDAAGNFYGATAFGGANQKAVPSLAPTGSAAARCSSWTLQVRRKSSTASALPRDARTGGTPPGV